jgi:hypothetical protein
MLSDVDEKDIKIVFPEGPIAAGDDDEAEADDDRRFRWEIAVLSQAAFAGILSGWSVGIFKLSNRCRASIQFTGLCSPIRHSQCLSSQPWEVSQLVY